MKGKLVMGKRLCDINPRHMRGPGDFEPDDPIECPECGSGLVDVSDPWEPHCYSCHNGELFDEMWEDLLEAKDKLREKFIEDCGCENANYEDMHAEAVLGKYEYFVALELIVQKTGEEK
jgi:hypothetical protein